MDDIFKSIKAFLYDRASSPLFGAFLVAWSVWNYRVITILLSSENTTTKFTNIDNLFKPVEIIVFKYQFSIYGEIINGILIPALATFSYIYIYPLIAKPVYEHSLKKQKELRIIKQKEEDNRLLSIEDSRKLYNKISALQNEFDVETEMYRNQVSSLTKTIKELETNINDTSNTSENTNNNFDDINDADIQEFDNSIRENIEAMPGGDFQLSELFNEKNWSTLSASNKQAIGKRLKKLVERGDYSNVTVKGKGSGNQIIYSKSNSKMTWPPNEELTDIEQAILIQFSGLQENHGYIVKDLQELVDAHIEEVRVYVDDLIDKGYLEDGGYAETGENFYVISPKGRKYLVKNNLFK